MSNCCLTNKKELISETSVSEHCPLCKKKGKKVKIITLKAMLKPSVLDSLNPDLVHLFCNSENCDVVYFDTDQKTYSISEIKAPVFQKDDSVTVPICYCFEWTREKIKQHMEDGLASTPLEHIKQNVKENRCGCEVNNPQGSCCMGNVTKFIKQFS